MDRRDFLIGASAASLVAAAGGGLLACGGGNKSSSSATNAATRAYGDVRMVRRKAAKDGPDVLLLVIDDCNDWVGFLNDHPGTITPNLDALAKESLSFEHAYCAAPMCGPARTGIFYGEHPWQTGVYDHTPPSDQAYLKLVKSTPSFIDDYWAAGYHTIGSGKLYHGHPYKKWDVYKPTHWYIPGYERKNPKADPARYDPDWISPYTGKPIGRDMPYTEIDFGPSGKTADQEPDGITTRWVQKQLEHIDQRPFVVGFGNYLPHEPWRIPKRFFDMHPLEDIVLPTVRADDLDDLPRYATEHIIDQLHQFRTIERHGLWKQAVQAYQAAITFADDRVGILLDTLAHSPFADDTIVVAISDHGFHLGEKMHIQKMTLWERATRVPFLLKVPGRFDHEQRFEPPVSTMDIGPTLAELCDIPTKTPYVGKSLLPLIADPKLADQRPPITTWLEGNHSVRRGPYRYIRYRTHETELYDHRVDPDEFTNIASDPAHRPLIAELDAFLPAD